jgi:hypothetical protein
MDLAGLVAHEDHRAAGDLAGAEIAGLLQLGIVPDIDPAAAEDARHLLAQDVVGDQHLAVEQERLLFAVIDNVGAGGHLFALVGWALELRYRAAGKRVNLGLGMAAARGTLAIRRFALSRPPCTFWRCR